MTKKTWTKKRVLETLDSLIEDCKLVDGEVIWDVHYKDNWEGMKEHLKQIKKYVKNKKP